MDSKLIELREYFITIILFMQLRLEAVKVLLHIGMSKKHNYNIILYPINYVGKDGLLKLGEGHVFKILVDKLSSDPIQVVTCCINIVDSQLIMCRLFQLYCNSCVVDIV